MLNEIIYNLLMAHIHDLIDFTAEVFIVYKDKVLLRFHDKYNMWLSVGGHIELDEDPNEAALREAREEVGLDVQLYDGHRLYARESEGYKELIPPHFMNIHKINDVHRHITMTFFAKSQSDVAMPSDDDERVDNWKWMTKSEILAADDMKESIKVYALKALEVLGE